MICASRAIAQGDGVEQGEVSLWRWPAAAEGADGDLAPGRMRIGIPGAGYLQRKGNTGRLLRDGCDTERRCRAVDMIRCGYAAVHQFIIRLAWLAFIHLDAHFGVEVLRAGVADQGEDDIYGGSHGDIRTGIIAYATDGVVDDLDLTESAAYQGDRGVRHIAERGDHRTGGEGELRFPGDGRIREIEDNGSLGRDGYLVGKTDEMGRHAAAGIGREAVAHLSQCPGLGDANARENNPRDDDIKISFDQNVTWSE